MAFSILAAMGKLIFQTKENNLIISSSLAGVFLVGILI